MKKYIILAGIFLTFCCRGSAFASIVYDNAVNTTTADSAPIDSVNGVVSISSFTLASNYTITDIVLYMTVADSLLSSIDYAITTNLPGEQSYSGTTSTSIVNEPINGNIFKSTITLNTPISLSSGTPYYLELWNAVGPNNGQPWLAFEYNSSSPSIAYQATPKQGSPGIWNAPFVPDPSYSNSFQLLGDPAAVPEPSTYALLCISLGVVGYARRRMAKGERLTAKV